MKKIEITQKLHEICEKITSENRKHNHGTNYGLMGGKMGELLFLSAYCQVLNTDRYKEYILTSLQEVVSCINKNDNSSTLANGLAGFGWALHKIFSYKIFREYDAASMLEEINEDLSDNMLTYIRTGNYDFLHGALGVFLYLNSVEYSDEKEKIPQLFNILYANAIAEKDHLKWDWFDPSEQKLHSGQYNLGISHGIPSILAAICKHLQTQKFAKKELHKAEMISNFILSTRSKSTNSNGSLFPSMQEPEENKKGSRFGWCYGDLGICCSLYHLYKLNNKDAYKYQIIDILSINTRRKSFEQTIINDPYLCHGTAGIAHIYNTFYKRLGKKEFEECSLYWLEETLKMLDIKNPISTKTNGTGLGFLEGLSGIGLALLSFISDEVDDWDECLFIS
jgi:lantibiotic modifying enzyme